MFCVRTNILAHFSGSGGSPIILSVSAGPLEWVFREVASQQSIAVQQH